MNRLLRHAVAGSLLSLSLLPGAPAALAIEVKFNEFASVVAGQIIKGDDEGNTGSTPCPCYIADWGNGFLYTKRHPLLAPETRIGGQMSVSFTDDFSFVLQTVARAGRKNLSLEWAYLSYEATPDITVQVGRKRIPIFYYSDFQDIGYAYVWARPPGELYGWDMNNFEGGSVRFRHTFGDVGLNTSFFGGNAAQKEAGYWKTYQVSPVDVRWNKLFGADAEVTREWLTARLVYIQSTNQYDAGDGWGDYGFNAGEATDQRILGLALNADFDKFFVLTETNKIDHTGSLVKYTSPSYSLGAGYRLGDWTPFVNYSDYTDKTTTPETFAEQRFDEWTATLRFDFAPGQDVKLQYNWFRDMSPVLFTGHTQIGTLSYDVSL